MPKTRAALAFLIVFALASVVAMPQASARGSRRLRFGTGPVVKSRNTTAPSQLVGIRVGRHRTFERVVFDFRGSLPSFQSVQYVSQVTEDGSGRPVPVAGHAFVEAAFLVNCSPVNDPAASCPPAPGIRRGFRTLRQIVPAGFFESTASYGIGLRRRVGFRVFELSNPPRVVVDFRR